MKLRNDVLSYLINEQITSGAQVLANNIESEKIGFYSEDSSSFWNLFPVPPKYEPLIQCDHMHTYNDGTTLIAFKYCPMCGIKL
jgi:hypothetical protein